jgi:hypothetical protein
MAGTTQSTQPRICAAHRPGTAIAPDAVFTVRTYGTPRGSPARISAQIRSTKAGNLQVSATRLPQVHQLEPTQAARLGPSLEEFVGHPAYGLTQLRQDLERFVFLLGGSDGEPLFGP